LELAEMSCEKQAAYITSLDEAKGRSRHSLRERPGWEACYRTVGRLFVEEVITECRKQGATRVDVLAFEFEMGLFPAVLSEAKIYSDSGSFTRTGF
jgi:hypothetical protein